MMLPLTPIFLTERLKRGVGGLLDELSEPFEGVMIEGRRDPAGVGPGIGRAGLAAELEQ